LRHRYEARRNSHLRYSSHYRHKWYELPLVHQRSSGRIGVVKYLQHGWHNRNNPQTLPT
jgi:hypothetical protein